MDRVQLSAPRLQELVAKFRESRIAVVGDFFLDKYLEVDPELAEPSLETGKTAHQVVQIRRCPGAAGTIVSNLAALGVGQLDAIGFVGDDGEGYDLRQGLDQLGCRIDHLHITRERFTPTYLKPRDSGVPSLDAEHNRYDTQNRAATPAAIEDAICRSIDSLLPDLDALIVMDQVEQAECGVVTSRVRQRLCQQAGQGSGPFFWADSRRRIRDFPGLIIKPNQFEAIGNESPLPEEQVPLDRLLTAARQLRQQQRAPVIVTRGTAGMLVSDQNWTVVPAMQLTTPVDPTGAGDSATAGTVLALTAGATLPEAAVVGCLVASITVQQIGTTGVAHPDQLADRLLTWQSQQAQTGR